jgi:hypothetical protein
MARRPTCETTQWVYLYTAYGKIGASRVKMMNFSAFPSFLTNSTIREKFRPKNIFIYGNQNV